MLQMLRSSQPMAMANHISNQYIAMSPRAVIQAQKEAANRLDCLFLRHQHAPDVAEQPTYGYG